MAACIEQQGDYIDDDEKTMDLGSELAMEMDDNSKKVVAEESDFFRLPVEMRAEIIERLDAKSILQLRCTHPLLKSLVDHYIGVNVSINDVPKKKETDSDVKNRLLFFGKLALRNISIANLSALRWLPGVNNSDMAEIRSFTRLFDTIFLHPEFLRSIHLDGPIHYYYIRKFFLSCPNLINFGASSNATVIGGLIYSRLSNQNLSIEEATTHLYKIHFRKLKFLKLFVMDPEKEDLNIRQTENSLSILRTLSSDCLKQMIIQVWITENYTFTTVCWALAAFMKLHPTLNSVFVCFLYEPTSLIGSIIFDEVEGAKLRKELLTVSKGLKLQKFGISSKSSHIRTWEEFIAEQKNLDHLSLTFSSNSRISNWEHLCQNSVKTLTQIFVRGEFLTPFDCFALECCSNLEEFCLHNTAEDPTQQTAIVKNVSYVPCRLRSLIFFNTIMTTEDILFLLKKLDRLEMLVLFKTGRGYGNGVNAECLQQALQMRTLMSILIVRFVANNRRDAKKIMQMMQMQEDSDNPSIALEENDEIESDWDSDDIDTDTDTTYDVTSSSDDSDLDDFPMIRRRAGEDHGEQNIFLDAIDDISEYADATDIEDNSEYADAVDIEDNSEYFDIEEGEIENLSAYIDAIEDINTDTQEIIDHINSDAQYVIEHMNTDTPIALDCINPSSQDVIDQIKLSSKDNIDEFNTEIQNISDPINTYTPADATMDEYVDAREDINMDIIPPLCPNWYDINRMHTNVNEERQTQDYSPEIVMRPPSLAPNFLSISNTPDSSRPRSYVSAILAGYNENDRENIVENDGSGIVVNDEDDFEYIDSSDDNDDAMDGHLFNDANLEGLFDFQGENIGAVNINPQVDELQLVFEGDIDLEDIDLHDIISVPEVQVHFVLDTVLDILSASVRHSHWTRTEDIYGNVVFTLKLCMKTDYN